jgi:multicomponent Na+:H+ antiporter subunit D
MNLLALVPHGIALPPLPVAGPLAVAGLMLAAGRLLPRRVPDMLAILTALAAGLVCAAMLARAADAPLVHWFGGWLPRGPLVLGIAFAVDQAGAALACFACLLFAATMIFAWGYYDEVHAHFHVLMLVFMAGMVGFCLTHDLFNMFVWFEAMSVAAFALTGFQLRSSALEGALSFTVVNTIGAYLILSGIALIYARVGALDFSALAAGVAAAPDDPLVCASFVLLASGLLIKGAQAPFHFWLPDAHAVAPSPVSVIFSGAMVPFGLYGVARLLFAVFATSGQILAVVHALLLGMGVLSAVLGGVMALRQRHIKRMLAFSTVSHGGVMMVGLAATSRAGLAGMLAYLVGHGLVKASLFMVAGILLATRASIDEIGLRGLGRGIMPAGVAMALGGLLLAGLPIGLMDGGAALIHGAATDLGRAAALVAATLTGAAVLRATGRIFLGLGPDPGDEGAAPSEDEQEKADRPLWLMLLPASVLLVCVVAGSGGLPLAWHASAAFMHPDTAAILGTPPGPPIAADAAVFTSPAPTVASFVSTELALLIAAVALGRDYAPRILRTANDRLSRAFYRPLEALHSGRVGDYVAWLTVGLAAFAVVFAAV